jgi:GntR family transcriptional regulator
MVVNLRRVLSFDQVPTIYDDIWLPGSVFKGLTLEAVEQNKGPMYAWFESKFGVSMVRADEKIGAVSATDEAASVLQVEAGSPLLHVERVSYTYGDRPMELRRGLYLTERFHYRNTLS